MIDIHSHILPGIDDGAQTIEDSLAMAREAVRQGIHTIIATPHHRNGVFENVKADIHLHTEALNEQLKNENIPLIVLPGQETRIHGEMLEELEDGVMGTLNGTNYLFVELPSSSVPRYAHDLLYNIRLAGYKPIIVHPERNSRIIEDPSIIYDFVSNGVLTQVTAGSVVGKFGKSIQKFTHQLIEANLTHFIASDAHNTTSRGFMMQEAYQVLGKEYGTELYYVFMENAQLLIEDKVVNQFEPERIKKKKFLGLF